MCVCVFIYFYIYLSIYLFIFIFLHIYNYLYILYPIVDDLQKLNVWLAMEPPRIVPPTPMDFSSLSPSTLPSVKGLPLLRQTHISCYWLVLVLLEYYPIKSH